MVAGDAGSATAGDEAASSTGDAVTDRPILTPHTGEEDRGSYTTNDLMNEVFDLMRRRLPKLAADDPGRRRVMALLPALGEALGRDQVVPVQAVPAHQSA